MFKRLPKIRAYLIRDPLGDYRAGLCPMCGGIIPLPPKTKHLDWVTLPRTHRCRPL